MATRRRTTQSLRLRLVAAGERDDHRPLHRLRHLSWKGALPATRQVRYSH
jgi:hypothetical protein